MNLNQHLDNFPIEAAVPQEIKEVFVEGLKKWLDENTIYHSGAHEIVFDLLGNCSHMAADEVFEMKEFVGDLLVFFCLPGNSKRFNEVSPKYRSDLWPVYLKRIHTALEQLGTPGARAEQYLHEAANYNSPSISSIVSAANYYQIQLPQVAA